MRSAKRAISQSNFLVLIPEIDPRKVVLLHPLHHMIEGILRMRTLAVRVDRYKGNPALTVFFRSLASHLI
ncbi:hypothetical protein D3C81_2002310 [compost metagenome]